MASINDICKEIVTDVDGALGCGVVDLSTGLLLGVAHNVPYFTQSYLDAVAAAAVDMFRGKTISVVEQLLSATRGSKVENTLKEVQMTTEKTYHFMSVIKDKPNCLLVLITKTTTNLGMGWNALRSKIATIAPLCP
jgi:predicted regulator of Ras-like GTPase activity (Roadblock/LC7/MglB family)